MSARAFVEEHDPLTCPGCYGEEAGGAHELLGTLHEGSVIVAVRTPDCPLNGTEHVWVLPRRVEPAHPFDWSYLRPSS